MKTLRSSTLHLAWAVLCTVSLLAQGKLPPASNATPPSPPAPRPMLTAAPRILKIDPPNWWAQMPKPMLLIRGENLIAARISLNDPSLKIASTQISENGHWAELWLNASPAQPRTVTLTVATPGGTASVPYRFEQRHAKAESFAGFSSADVMYLIMTDRFADGDLTNDGTPAEHAAELAKPRGWHGGDLRGIEQHIDYLQDLGVNTVWITPVYQNHGAESYHGYGATDMYGLDEHYGSLRDLQSLAHSLHSHHMKLVLDTVPNHVGAAHPWVNDAPEPTWFHGTVALHSPAQGDFKPLTDPHAPRRDQRNVTEGWFANILPDLNQENPAVARYLIQNAIWWTEQAGLDGLRLDTFPYIARPFWHEFHAQLHALYPQLTTVGEIMNPDATITSSFAGGVTRTGPDTGLDTPFDYPLYFSLVDTLLKGAPMTRLADTLRLDALYPHPERLVTFLGNHDVPRFLDDPSATPQKLQLAFTILATMRGMPQLYSGDEIAMRGGEDPDNRRDFPGGFSDQPTANTFNAPGRTPEQRQTFDQVKTLLALRRAHPALQTGDEQILHADHDTLVYVRYTRSQSSELQRILVAVNKGEHSQEANFGLSGTVLEGAHTVSTLLGDRKSLDLTSTKLTLHLEAGSTIIALVE